MFEIVDVFAKKTISGWFISLVLISVKESRLGSEITKLQPLQSDLCGSATIVFSTLCCSLVWCALAFSLTMAEHIPASLPSILNKFFCVQKYSILLGISVLIDGVMGAAAYHLLFDRMNLIRSKLGFILASFSFLCFILFQLFFFLPAESVQCSTAHDITSILNTTSNQWNFIFLIMPILVFRYLIYHPLKVEVNPS